MLGKFFNKNKTFKPLKSHGKGGNRSRLSEYAKATLGSGNMRSAVVLPKGEVSIFFLCSWAGLAPRAVGWRCSLSSPRVLLLPPRSFAPLTPPHQNRT